MLRKQMTGTTSSKGPKMKYKSVIAIAPVCTRIKIKHA